MRSRLVSNVKNRSHPHRREGAGFIKRISAPSHFINNPKIMLGMGQSGRNRAMKLYDEDVVIKRQLDLIAKYVRND